MMASGYGPDIGKLAVVDDNRDEVVVKSSALRRAGIDVVPIVPDSKSLDELVRRIKDNSDSALCDNVLRYQSPAEFDGAEAVAALYDEKFPAVLMSEFYGLDCHVSIRRWRQRIPVVLHKSEADPSRIRQGLLVCAKEHQQQFSPTRRACRTLLRVRRIEQEANEQVVDVEVLSWNASMIVRLPASLLPGGVRAELPDNTRQAIERDMYLVARVNTGAQSDADLFFADFELAPDPISEDDFANTDDS